MVETGAQDTRLDDLLDAFRVCYDTFLQGLNDEIVREAFTIAHWVEPAAQKPEHQQFASEPLPVAHISIQFVPNISVCKALIPSDQIGHVRLHFNSAIEDMVMFFGRTLLTFIQATPSTVEEKDGTTQKLIRDMQHCHRAMMELARPTKQTGKVT